MNTIGIDFGTCFSSASWINPNTGLAESILFGGQQKIPTLLFYDETYNGPDVGLAVQSKIEECRNMNANEADVALCGLIRHLKREMNPHLSIPLPNGVRINHTELIGEFFKYIKAGAEERCFHGQSVQGVVITHPVDFDTFKKEMLFQAAEIAGFTSIDLLMEPVAAAMGYMNSQCLSQTGVLVYDFGGGTFDLAFVQFYDEGNYKIPVTRGDSNCGGYNLDFEIYQMWDAFAHTEHGRRISAHANEIDFPFLNTVCVKNKELMSLTGKDNTLGCTLPAPGFQRMSYELSHAKWQDMMSIHIDKTVQMTREVAEEVAQLGYSIDKVILIGGSSQIPLVREKLASIPSDILPIDAKHVNAWDVAVAHGAALYKSTNELIIAKDVFCMQCGGKISTAHRFCMHCGCQNSSYDERFNK